MNKTIQTAAGLAGIAWLSGFTSLPEMVFGIAALAIYRRELHGAWKLAAMDVNGWRARRILRDVHGNVDARSAFLGRLKAG